MNKEEIELKVKKTNKRIELFDALMFLLGLSDIAITYFLITKQVINGKPYMLIGLIALALIIIGIIIVKVFHFKTRLNTLVDVLLKNVTDYTYNIINNKTMANGNETKEGSIRYNYKYEIEVPELNLIIKKYDVEVLKGYDSDRDGTGYYWTYRKLFTYIDLIYVANNINEDKLNKVLPDEYKIESIQDNKITIKRDVTKYLNEILTINDIKMLYNYIKECEEKWKKT